ncbi:hypothetical protein FA13DRAFT_1325573 [Coprinellus micaceus]|uniref:Uncharacterized protein n=1 Tax=Coprinellus micaceus TaxID=71717 RepID=A0A4Y7SRR0_COPMI|nr:hypothetical protein FA13DRAFT_1325573 [Coprinellus micaceus]
MTCSYDHHIFAGSAILQCRFADPFHVRSAYSLRDVVVRAQNALTSWKACLVHVTSSSRWFELIILVVTCLEYCAPSIRGRAHPTSSLARHPIRHELPAGTRERDESGSALV